MNPADWNRVKDLFDRALGFPPAERAAFVASQAIGPEILAEVRSLLTAYEESPEFLEEAHPEIELGDSRGFAERRVGPWRLLREVGHGGMGVVWEAVRDDQEYQQRVAIKVLPPGLLSPAKIARFREERQILASLTHPGIARLLDGGTASDGTPYLVMEYIEGERLDDWCEQHAPSLPQRLELFLAICAAVAYAHRHLVIHRDLKPANILVTAEGSAKLLDFGIAKLLNAEGGARQGSTRTMPCLTPEYASPEQIRGESVSTATDTYSLGVVLYRLLTGRTPYTADPENALEMMRAICEEDPAPPSAVAGAGARELRGELDAIVLQALRKDPENRYPTVRALADDVSAWLEGRPVAAHSLPWWQRSLRHIRRHKTQSLAVSAILLSILGGSLVSLWYARDAERARRVAEVRFQEGRQLAHTVVFELYEAIAHLPGATRARQILVDRALRYLKDLEASGPASRDLEVELARAYARIGDVQGNPTQAHLGDTKAAIESETEARRLALAVLRSYPGDADAEAILADADERLTGLGELQGKPEELQGLWKEGMEIRRRQAAHQPGEPAPAAAVLKMEARSLRWQGKWSEALATNLQAAAMFRQALAKDPRSSDLGDRLSTTYHEIARCWKELNRLEEALASYRQAQQLDEARQAASPGDADAQTDLSFDLLESGWVDYRLGRYKKAIAGFEQALAIQERLSAADPQDIRMRLEAAKLRNTAAPAYEAAGDRAKAIETLKTAGEQLEAALASDPENQDTRLHVGWVWCNLGAVYERAANEAKTEAPARAYWSDAEWCYRRALDALAKLRGSGRLDLGVDPRPTVARAESGLAACRRHLPAGRN